MARLDYILTMQIGIHPLALAHFDALKRYASSGTLCDDLAPFARGLRAEAPHDLQGLLRTIERRTAGYDDRRKFFTEQIAKRVAWLCEAFHPRPVLVYMSDLGSEVYRGFLGGQLFESDESSNGHGHVARHSDERFLPALEMELEALRIARANLGAENLRFMAPAYRNAAEGAIVTGLVDRYGLES